MSNTENTTDTNVTDATEGFTDGGEDMPENTTGGTSTNTADGAVESAPEDTSANTGGADTSSASHIIPPRVVVRFTARNLRKKNGEHHPGSNSAGDFGYVLMDFYECPCGAGTVEEKRFFTTRDEWAKEEYSVYLQCSECRSQYKFTKNPTYTPASNWALIPR